MKFKWSDNDQAEESTFSRLLKASEPSTRPAPCADKMGLQDACILVEVRVHSKHRLIYHFRRGGIYECFFGKKEIHLAGRKFEQYLEIMTDLMAEQFLKVIRTKFGWCLARGRPRQKHLIFLLPEEMATGAPEGNRSANLADAQDFSI